MRTKKIGHFCHKILIMTMIAVFVFAYVPLSEIVYANDTSVTINNHRRTSITLPNRRLTDAERQAWIDNYNAMGGATALELEVIRQVNLVRAEHGLAQVSIDPALMKAARFYSQTMSTFGGLGHNKGPYTPDPRLWQGASGNVAMAFGGRQGDWHGGNGIGGVGTAEGAVRGWMNSPGHRDFMLCPGHRYAGFGLYRGPAYLFLAPYSSIVISSDELWGFGIDTDGNTVIQAISPDGLWGLVDTDCNIIAPFIYSSIERFVNGLAVARQNDLLGVIDTRGNVVVPFRPFDFLDSSPLINYATLNGREVPLFVGTDKESAFIGASGLVWALGWESSFNMENGHMNWYLPDGSTIVFVFGREPAVLVNGLPVQIINTAGTQMNPTIILDRAMIPIIVLRELGVDITWSISGSDFILTVNQ